VLRNGDIVGIDVGVRKNGYVGDGARTFAVGGITEGTERLVRVTREALDLAISIVREGGHGVGTELHEEPEIPNYGDPGLGPVLKAGMILAIEPMLNAGGPGVETLADNWTVVTADRHRSAHFEHTMAVTATGADILTQ
jgi:methionyl aminopeptidase